MRDQQLRRRIAEVADVPSALGYYLRRHDPAILAARLGCDVYRVLHLHLCATPAPERWGANVAAIATFAGVPVGVLDQFLREELTAPVAPGA